MPPTPPDVVIDPNPEFISCGAITHLEIDETGRILVVEGTESTVGLTANDELRVDVGNDGAAEHTLGVGEEASLPFGDGSTVEMIWTENNWVSLTRQC
jgi:hypothetical protein